MGSGTDDTDRQDGGVTADEAFALVGNRVRAEILRTLSRARGGEGELRALSFSELRSRTDLEVNSSQFNYHLQQLLGTFVERREERTAQLDARMAGDAKAGYVLRPEGTVLTRTIRARAVANDGSIEPFDTDLDCFYCGTTVEATYGNALFMARCPGCDYTYEYDFAPAGGGTDDERATLARIGDYLRHRRLTVADGVCPRCANRLQSAFVRPAETAYPRTDRREVLVNRWCDHCGERAFLRTGELLLREPALVGFCDDHDVDVRTARLWELEFAATDRYVTVQSTDPWRVSFRLDLGRDAFDVVLEDDLSVERR